MTSFSLNPKTTHHTTQFSISRPLALSTASSPPTILHKLLIKPDPSSGASFYVLLTTTRADFMRQTRPSPSHFIFIKKYSDVAGAVGGDDDGDDKEKEEEAERERLEAIREAEERRKEKHRKMEEEREKMRQEIRDKVG